MADITLVLAPEEFDRILIALDWYADDREECAEMEERGLYDAGADESRAAAKKAARLLNKLRSRA